LITGLIVANIVYPQAYNIADITKALITISVGWLAYHVIFKKLSISLPRVFEEFEHLVGVMSLTLILLFWMAFYQYLYLVYLKNLSI
jgi:multicomponent Na+:H+ antiporter subunit D